MSFIRFTSLAFTLLVSFQSVGSVDDKMTIKDIHRQMQSKKLTSEKLVQFYLHRINTFDQHGEQLNSVVQVNKKALEQAKDLDRYFELHGFKGSLHGIPVLLKDNIDTLDGMANTAGSTALSKNYPKRNAFLVEQLKASGAIILGKTNLSQWANFRSTTASSGWSALYGQSKNPYGISISPCGSSSGSGIAVAANFATVTIGTETDGSITCPAAITGVVGIKPTLGTVSRTGIIPIAHSQDTAGPLARNVTDAVILLSAMVKTDMGDSDTIESTIDYLSHLKLGGVKGKRIGIARNLMGYHKELDNVFSKAVRVLKDQGAIIIDNTNFKHLEELGAAEFEVLLYEFKHDLNTYLSHTADGIPKSLADMIQYNKAHAAIEMPHFGQELFEMAQAKGDLTDEVYINALASSKKLAREFGIDALLKQYDLDLIIAPTTGPGWKIDWVHGDNHLGSASSPAAVAGYPHITIPMGYVNGLPVGLSMFSGKLQEGTLIETAFGYEQVTQHRVSPKLN